MRKMTMAAAAVAAAMLVLAAAPTAAQDGGTAMAINYQLTGTDTAARVDGVSGQVEVPRWGNVTLVGNGAYAKQHMTGGVQTLFVGGGIGYRASVSERVDAFVHGLFGVEVGSSSVGNAFQVKPRIGGGIAYAVGESVRLRAGVDYDTHPHLLAGIGFRF